MLRRSVGVLFCCLIEENFAVSVISLSGDGTLCAAHCSRSSERPPPAGEQGRPNIQMVKPQTPVVFGGRERHLHVQSIDIVAGVNGVALITGDSG